MVGDYMERHHVKFARGMVPEKFEKVGTQTRVYVDGKVYGDFDTVLLAIGRKGCAGLLNLEAAGVTYDAASGKIKCVNEQTNVPHIYAVGDVLAGFPELTPVAIQAGRKLVKRLFAGSTRQMDYTDIATTVFTPLEYGCVGLSEEDAWKKFGKENIVTYHGYGKDLAWNISSERADDQGYFKVVCQKEGEKVVGFHMLGVGIGDAIQGIGVAIKAGFTKEHLDETVGIHPTFAEGYTTLTEVKEEGKKLESGGGC